MGEILILSGGKKIEVSTNAYCSLCGKETHQSVCCHFHKASICPKHCKECRYFKKEFQQCVYKELPKDIRKIMQEKTPGERTPDAVPKQQKSSV